MIWRRRALGKGSEDSDSGKVRLNTHLPLHSSASNLSGSMPQFPSREPRMTFPQLPSCCEDKHPSEITWDSEGSRRVENPNLTRQQEGGGRKQWYLARPHSCHRTLHNTTASHCQLLYWHFYLAKTLGFVQHLLYSKVCACAYSHAKCPRYC